MTRAVVRLVIEPAARRQDFLNEPGARRDPAENGIDVRVRVELWIAAQLEPALLLHQEEVAGGVAVGGRQREEAAVRPIRSSAASDTSSREDSCRIALSRGGPGRAATAHRSRTTSGFAPRAARRTGAGAAGSNRRGSRRTGPSGRRDRTSEETATHERASVQSGAIEQIGVCRRRIARAPCAGPRSWRGIQTWGCGRRWAASGGFRPAPQRTAG